MRKKPLSVLDVSHQSPTAAFVVFIELMGNGADNKPSYGENGNDSITYHDTIHGVENSEQSCGSRGFGSPFGDGDNDFLLGWPEGRCWELANLAVADFG